MPQFAIHPGDAGDEAVGFNGAKDCPGLRVDLMDLAVAILPDPQRSFGPGHSGATTARRRNRAKHAASAGINLLKALVSKLIQVLAVKRSPCMRRNIDGASCSATLWI